MKFLLIDICAEIHEACRFINKQNNFELWLFDVMQRGIECPLKQDARCNYVRWAKVYSSSSDSSSATKLFVYNGKEIDK